MFHVYVLILVEESYWQLIFIDKLRLNWTNLHKDNRPILYHADPVSHFFSMYSLAIIEHKLMCISNAKRSLNHDLWIIIISIIIRASLQYMNHHLINFIWIRWVGVANQSRFSLSGLNTLFMNVARTHTHKTTPIQPHLISLHTWLLKC